MKGCTLIRKIFLYLRGKIIIGLITVALCGWRIIFGSVYDIIRERSSITSAGLGGVVGLSQNADTADALEGSGGSDSKC